MESLLVIRSVAVTNTRAPPCCGASAPHFAEHHITLLCLSSLPPSSVRLHRTSPTSLYAPIRTRAYNFRHARWRDVGKGDKTRLNAATCGMRARRPRPRRARSHGLQRVHSKHSWSVWSFSPVTRYDFKPACKISLMPLELRSNSYA